MEDKKINIKYFKLGKKSSVEGATYNVPKAEFVRKLNIPSYSKTVKITNH